jgi:hypothetical protein
MKLCMETFLGYNEMTIKKLLLLLSEISAVLVGKLEMCT